jgi:ABC-type cobalamin/Fe3+-siderophores transport systems, ATPase components
MLTLKEIRFKKVLHEINLSLESGKLYSLFGKNGAGKTTLLKVITQIWEPSEGSIYWDGQDLSRLSRRELSRLYTLVPQGGGASFSFTIEEFVVMGRYSFSEPTSDITPFLQMVDLLHLKDKRIDQVSLGERQKAYIARGLATESPLLLLDEPTAHLDSENQLHIWHLLKELTQTGRTIFTATHDLYWAKKFSDKIFNLESGTVVSS